MDMVFPPKVRFLKKYACLKQKSKIAVTRKFLTLDINIQLLFFPGGSF